MLPLRRHILRIPFSIVNHVTLEHQLFDILGIESLAIRDVDTVVIVFEKAVHFSGFEIASLEIAATTGAGLLGFWMRWTSPFLAAEFEVGVSGSIRVDDREDQKTCQALKTSWRAIVNLTLDRLLRGRIRWDQSHLS